MRINNNIMAINTHRQYSINNENMAATTKKLSSGYRINSAADDAAGLAISEKMRAQIRGLDMASKNSEDGISLVQTAEGALEETESILQRMRELSVQSASDTNEDTVDRAALDAEYQQLIAEIDDISSKTNFNGMTLMDGSLSQSVEAAFSGTSEMAYSAGSTAAAGDQAAILAGMSISNTSIEAGDYTFTYTAGTAETSGGAGDATASEISFTDGTNTYTVAAGADGGATATDFGAGTFNIMDGADVVGTLTLNAAAATSVANANVFNGFTDDIAAAADQTAISTGMTITNGNGSNTIADGAYTMSFTASVSSTSAAELELTDGTNTYTVSAGTGDEDFAAGTYNVLDDSDNVVGTITLSADAAAAVDNANAVDFATVTASNDSVILQTGSNEGDTLSIQIDDMSATGLAVTGTDISSQETASAAITTVNDAINSVSTQRAHLGALQNRLEHKINNLDTSSENLSAAESRIRDVDMAQEMTEYTQTSILVQAATSMLAQANSAPQNVLSLLQ